MDQKEINKQIFARLRKLEKAEFLDTTEKPGGQDEARDGMKNLAKKTGVSEDKINAIFNVEGGLLTVLQASGSNPKEKTKSISLLTLLGYKYLLNKNDVLAQEIRRNVAENGIPLENFATHLNELVPSLIRRKGKVKSPKTMYRLMVLGESKARGLIKEVCKKD
jgi:hypothetical protein